MVFQKSQQIFIVAFFQLSCIINLAICKGTQEVWGSRSIPYVGTTFLTLVDFFLKPAYNRVPNDEMEIQMEDTYVLPSLVQILTKLNEMLILNNTDTASQMVNALHAFDDVPGVLDHIHILQPALTHDNVPTALHLVQEIMLPHYSQMC